MADEPARTGSWWATIPGILTATAGVITAATGLLAILAQNGFLGEKNKTFVSEKSAAVRDAVSPATPPSSGLSATEAKPAPLAATAANPPSTVGSTTTAQRESAASGISPVPLHAIPFTGAVVTLLDGSIVKLRDDVKEYYAGTALKTSTGQVIEMQRMRRFELSDWRETKGNARITLNSGEVIDVRVEAYLLRGSNDLGDFSATFDKIRSVEFVR